VRVLRIAALWGPNVLFCMPNGTNRALLGGQATKALLREPFSREWEAYCAGEAVGAWPMLASQPMVETLGAVLRRLSKAKPADEAKPVARL
jgi:hypothetical protein